MELSAIRMLSSYKRHMRRKHDNVAYTCDLCYEVLKVKRIFKYISSSILIIQFKQILDKTRLRQAHE